METEEIRAALLELVREFCERVYEELAGDYPQFYVHSWQDKVLAAIQDPENPESAAVLAREEQFRAIRDGLSSSFIGWTEAVKAAPDEVLIMTAQTLLQQAGGFVHLVTKSAPHHTASLMAEVQAMAVSLQGMVE